MQFRLIWATRLILLGVIHMSHHDKKFKDESQDARRRDHHQEVHPDEKKKKRTEKDHKKSLGDD